MKHAHYIAHRIAPWACMALCCVWALGGHAADISVGTATTGGGVATVPINYAAGNGDAAAGLQFDIEFDASRFAVEGLASGPAADDSGKQVVYSVVDDGTLRVVVIGLNQDTLLDGALAELYLVPIDNASSELPACGFDNVVASGPQGEEISVDYSTLNRPEDTDSEEVFDVREDAEPIPELSSSKAGEGSENPLQPPASTSNLGAVAPPTLDAGDTTLPRGREDADELAIQRDKSKTIPVWPPQASRQNGGPIILARAQSPATASARQTGAGRPSETRSAEWAGSAPSAPESFAGGHNALRGLGDGAFRSTSRTPAASHNPGAQASSLIVFTTNGATWPDVAYVDVPNMFFVLTLIIFGAMLLWVRASFLVFFETMLAGTPRFSARTSRKKKSE